MYHGEKFNSISHLAGAVFALVGLGALLAVSIEHKSWPMIISFTVFGLTLVMLYTASTLYHSFHPPKLKKLFRTFDHIAIYLLIAGTYTPYMMVSLANGNGHIMLAAIWILALIGTYIELLANEKLKFLQLFIYLAMGWICTLEYHHLHEAVSTAGLFWLTLGGIIYTVGVIFYVLDDMKKLRHAHGIWHIFVLGGSICHFISIIAYVR